MDVSLALYRKYRPGSLDEVIGQEHVVEPLTRALESDNIHHAYLFSGPRGCGKTSSARILARSLNCVEGPTPTPCGVCNSCVDLAPDGNGSIDVIELDAATHGLVDDARDLREKAVYAPVVGKYKIYIIDEAHQLGPGAANALLKLVEEPPPHLRFVFATTEPDKIIGTIRSRTHHYGFRLVPARTLQTHLAWICKSEGVEADDAALALVARASGGSVRDSLSILGQLIAGAGPDGLTYAEAQKQLGVTDGALLDELVAALANEDGATLFRLVDTIIETGHDPRRFVTDVLDRLRDLLIVSQVPDAQESGLIDGPPELVDELVAQAKLFGLPKLIRSADVINEGLSKLRGATAPKLQLELIMAKMLVSSDAEIQGSVGAPAAQAPVAQAPAAQAPAAQAPATAASAPVEAAAKVRDKAPTRPPSRSKPEPNAEQEPPPAPPKLSEVAPSTKKTADTDSKATDASPSETSPPESSAPEASSPDASAPAKPAKKEPADPVEAPEASAPEASAAKAAAPTGELTLAQVEALWPSILDAAKNSSRVAWLMIVDASPQSVSGNSLTLNHSDQGTVKSFGTSRHADKIAEAISSVVGTPVRVTMTTNGSAPVEPQAKEDVVESKPTGESVDVEDIDSIALLERELDAVTISDDKA